MVLSSWSCCYGRKKERKKELWWALMNYEDRTYSLFRILKYDYKKASIKCQQQKHQWILSGLRRWGWNAECKQREKRFWIYFISSFIETVFCLSRLSSFFLISIKSLFLFTLKQSVVIWNKLSFLNKVSFLILI